MTDKKTAMKPKGTLLGTMLTIGATAVVTYLAATKKKEIVDGINKIATAGAALAQKMADGDFMALAPDKMNGTKHAGAPAN